MKEITAIFRSEKLDEIKEALAHVDIKGITVIEVKGRGEQLGISEKYRGSTYKIDLIPKTMIMTVVHDESVDKTVEAICKTAHTGNIGDGKIFIKNVEEVIRIRTNERGDTALD